MPSNSASATYDEWNPMFMQREYWPKVTAAVTRRLRRYATELERTVFEVITFLASSDGGNPRKPEGWTGGINALTEAVTWWTTRAQKRDRIRNAVRNLKRLGVLMVTDSKASRGRRAGVTLRWFPGQSGPINPDICRAVKGDTASHIICDTESANMGHGVPYPLINTDPTDLNKDNDGIPDRSRSRARAKAPPGKRYSSSSFFSSNQSSKSNPDRAPKTSSEATKIRELSERIRGFDHLEGFVGVRSLVESVGADAVEYVLDSTWPPENIQALRSPCGVFVNLCRQASEDGARPKTPLEKQLEKLNERLMEALRDKSEESYARYNAINAEIKRLTEIQERQAQLN